MDLPTANASDVVSNTHDAVLSPRLARKPQNLPRPPELSFDPMAEEISFITVHKTQLDIALCHPDELTLLHGNVAPKRHDEFALGRYAARLALQKSGWDQFAPLLRKECREPAWPTGFVGSITHCGEWAAAAVARYAGIKSIGIDLEDARAVPVDQIIDLVCSEGERSMMAGGHAQQKFAAIFSAKEAAYKALFPLCHTFFDFHALELLWVPESRSFIGTLRQELTADLHAGYRLRIGVQRRGDFVFTQAVITN